MGNSDLLIGLALAAGAFMLTQKKNDTGAAATFLDLPSGAKYPTPEETAVYAGAHDLQPSMYPQAFALLAEATRQANQVEIARAIGQLNYATNPAAPAYIETGGATRYVGPDVTGPIDYQGNQQEDYTR